MSPGDVKWGIAFCLLLGLLFSYCTLKAWFNFRKTGAKKEWIGIILCGIFTLGMIPAEMLLRSYTSARIVLDDNAITILLRPMCPDQSMLYTDITYSTLTTITDLGGVGKINGYSNGRERIGWFRMLCNHRKVYVCSKRNKVLLIENREGTLFLLSPPDWDRFLEDFETLRQKKGTQDGKKT